MKTGIVLEGGAFRGLFTAGALDCLMDNQLLMDYVLEVSARDTAQKPGRSTDKLWEYACPDADI